MTPPQSALVEAEARYETRTSELVENYRQRLDALFAADLDQLIIDTGPETQEWPALQSTLVELPERVGGWTPPPAVFDRDTALDNMKRRATPMAMRPDPIAQLAPAALDQPGDDGPLTAETQAWIGQGPADDDMPGRTPARPSRWDRWMGWLSDSGSRIENRLRAVGEPKGGA